MARFQVALWAVALVALTVSVVTDLKSTRILDVVTWPALALCLLIRGWSQGLGDLSHGLITGLVCALGAAAFWVPGAVKGRFGWGDVKLLAVVGAALGFPAAVAAVIFVALVGAVQAVVTMGLSPPQPGRRIPYGIAIALGSLAAMVWQRLEAP